MAILTVSCPADRLARIHVDDDAGRAVAESVGPLEIDIAPGRYVVRATARSRVAVNLVSVGDTPVRVRLELGDEASAAPMLGTTAFDSGHANLLDGMLAIHAEAGPGIVVLARHVDGTRTPPAVEVGIARGDRDFPLRWTESAGARCAAVDLPPGLCIATVDGDVPTAMTVPVWWGWRTIVVVPVVSGRPVMEHAALHCLPVGMRWADGQALATLTEELIGATSDGVAVAEIAAAVDGESPLHHLLRGDAAALARFDPDGVVVPADLIALQVEAQPGGDADAPPAHVDEPPVLARSADALLYHEARHPWSLGEHVSARYASRLASAVWFRWRADGRSPLPPAAPKRWNEDVRRFAPRRVVDRPLRRVLGATGSVGPAGRRLLAHVADRSYARRVPPHDVVEDPVGDLVLTTGLPAAALQAGLGEATTVLRRWRRIRIGAASAGLIVVAAVVVGLWPDPAGGWPVPDETTVAEDGSVFIDVLGNDDRGRPVQLLRVDPAGNGTVTIQGGGVTYAPNPDFAGTDVFTYVADDGTEQGEATVEVTVEPVNDQPVAVDDAASAAIRATIEIDVLANDTDIDGDELTIDGVVDPSGRATVAGDKIQFTATPLDIRVPEAQAVFAYEVSDGNGGSARAQVVVQLEEDTVPTGPTAADDAADTSMATPVDIDVTANDARLTDGTEVVLEERPTSGEVQLEGRVVRYVPDADFVGTDRFTYRLATGGTTSDPATVTVRVLPFVLISDVETAEAEGGEPPRDLVMQVKLTGPSRDTVTLAFTAVGITASEGSDFGAASGLVTFQPGQTVAELTVQILGDDEPEDDEVFEVRLSDVTNALVDPEFGVGTVTILDVPPPDDVPSQDGVE